MPTDLVVIVPSRGRPENVRQVIGAWDFTNAWDVADLVVAVDADDPEIGGYRAIWAEDNALPARLTVLPAWKPMVHKLELVTHNLWHEYFAVGFAGDDHLPRTINWAKTYLAALRELGSGMVYSDDGYQGEKLSSEWAITSDVVRAWGRMVPAAVEHMYCDQALLELMQDAGAVRYLPHVQIEHLHPFAKKAASDEQYKRVNSSEQFAKDRRVYESWATSDERTQQLNAVKLLRRGRPEERSARRRRKIETRRSRPTMSRRSPFPHFFRQVKNVTPEDIGITLADLASQVPADRAIVELGVYHGASALRLAWGARQGLGAHVWAIDPWDSEGNVYGDTMGNLEQARRWARHWVTSLGYSGSITLLHRFSHDVAADWSDEQPRVGLLFVDGDHTEAGARRDIESWAPHLAEGAIIAVDDYVNENYPEVGKAVDDLVDEGLLAPVEVYHDRLAVTRLAGKDPSGDREPESRVTAITSEGVHVEMPHTSLTVGTEPDEFDMAMSTAPVTVSAEPVLAEPEPDRERVTLDEAVALSLQPGAPITDLTIPQLKALAKERSITLGARKDKRELILGALRDGR